MPIPYAKILLSNNGGAPQAGPVTVAAGDVLQPSAESMAYWEDPPAVWRIMYWPEDWPGPGAGWTFNAETSAYEFIGNTNPPEIEITSTSGLFGKWLLMLEVMGGFLEGVEEPTLLDTIGWQLPSAVLGLTGIARWEEGQFDTVRGWVGEINKNFGRLDSIVDLLNTAVEQGTTLSSAKAMATTDIATLSGIPSSSDTDNITLAADDFIFLGPYQVNTAQRGLWKVASGAWTRAPVADTATKMAALLLQVLEGTGYERSLWQYTGSTTITLGVTSLTFDRLPGTAEYFDLAGATASNSANALVRRSAAGRIDIGSLRLPRDIGIHQALGTESGDKIVVGTTTVAELILQYATTLRIRGEVGGGGGTTSLLTLTPGASPTAETVLDLLTKFSLKSQGMPALRFDNNSAGAKLGFFGADPILRPDLTGDYLGFTGLDLATQIANCLCQLGILGNDMINPPF